MARLRLEFVVTETFKSSFQRLPPEIKKKVRKQLRILQHNPRHPSLRIHRLNDEWEFYVDIHYRCFFLWSGNTITLLVVGTHSIVDRYRS